MEDIIHNLSLKQTISASTNIVGEENLLKQQKLEKEVALMNSKNTHSGRWSLEEQVLYLRFIENEKVFLANKEGRRSSKIFKMMSKFIVSRGPDQCRSHHQKMQKKYDTISNIIENCRNSLQKFEEHGLSEKQKNCERVNSQKPSNNGREAEEIRLESKNQGLQAQRLEQTPLFYDQNDDGLLSELEYLPVEDLLEISQQSFQLLL